tara:strand:+ start:1305 stop:1889 length:585 start_codon:yes stop_codon:yes gene_type:complete
MPNVLIVGAGTGLSASLARCFRKAGYSVSLAARNTVKLQELAHEIGAQLFTCDVSEKSDVHTLFEELDNHNFMPDTVIYNAGAYTRGPITEIDTDITKETLMINSFGALLVAQQAAKRMLKNGRGAMLFTGASAVLKASLNRPLLRWVNLRFEGCVRAWQENSHLKTYTLRTLSLTALFTLPTGGPLMMIQQSR